MGDGIETMEAMVMRLGDCGGAAQARAVIKAIKAIQTAPGVLDMQNGAIALYWLAVALKGKDHAPAAIAEAAAMVEREEV